jgi:hypothetical protein
VSQRIAAAIRWKKQVKAAMRLAGTGQIRFLIQVFRYAASGIGPLLWH